MVALLVEAELSGGPAIPALEPVLSEGEGVLCEEPLELGVTFHVVMAFINIAHCMSTHL